VAASIVIRSSSPRGGHVGDHPVEHLTGEATSAGLIGWSPPHARVRRSHKGRNVRDYGGEPRKSAQYMVNGNGTRFPMVFSQPAGKDCEVWLNLGDAA
jgi:hypothetical protein